MIDSLYNKYVIYPFVYSLELLQESAKSAANYIKDAHICLKNIQPSVNTVSVELIRCTKTQLQFCVKVIEQNGTIVQHLIIYNIAAHQFQENLYIDKCNSYVELNIESVLQALQIRLPLCVQCFSFNVKPIQIFIQAPAEAYIDLQKNEPVYLKTRLNDAARLQALYNCSISVVNSTLTFTAIGGETERITTWQVWRNTKDFQTDKKYKGLYSINGYSKNIDFSFGASVISELNETQTTLAYTLQPGVQV